MIWVDIVPPVLQGDVLNIHWDSNFPQRSLPQNLLAGLSALSCPPPPPHPIKLGPGYAADCVRQITFTYWDPVSDLYCPFPIKYLSRICPTILI